jgi:hypothetical protein
MAAFWPRAGVEGTAFTVIRIQHVGQADSGSGFEERSSCLCGTQVDTRRRFIRPKKKRGQSKEEEEEEGKRRRKASVTNRRSNWVDDLLSWPNRTGGLLT